MAAVAGEKGRIVAEAAARSFGRGWRMSMAVFARGRSGSGGGGCNPAAWCRWREQLLRRFVPILDAATPAPVSAHAAVVTASRAMGTVPAIEIKLVGAVVPVRAALTAHSLRRCCERLRERRRDLDPAHFGLVAGGAASMIS